MKRNDVKLKSDFQEGIKNIISDTHTDKYKRLSFPLNFLKTHRAVDSNTMELIEGNSRLPLQV